MKSKNLFSLIVLAVLLASLVPAAAAVAPPAGEPGVSTGVAPANPEGGGIQSLSGSFVTFDPSVGGDICYEPGTPQTFCFEAHSFTNDYEYVYDLWTMFPGNWQVLNVYVVGTPTCTNGSWGTFSWGFETSPYEVDIYHPRYQSTTDECVAHYCFDVIPGFGISDALESWYWDGDGWGGAPHNPCSDDQYTPAGQNVCDEYVEPQAAIPICTPPVGVFLDPEQLDVEGCACQPQEHELTAWNLTGSDTDINLSYNIVAGSGFCGGPASLYVADGTGEPFLVDIEARGDPGDVTVCEVYAEDSATPNYNDTSWIIKTLFVERIEWEQIATEPDNGRMDNVVAAYDGYIWDITGYGGNANVRYYDPATDTWTTVAGSAPTFGVNYARSGCTHGNTVYTYGDAFTAGFTGLWAYDMDANTWTALTPGGTPPAQTGIWAPAWAYDPVDELCYMTGGATAPGAGNLTTVYVYDPATNAWLAPLPNFTSVRDFHAAFVYNRPADGHKLLCVVGGNNGAGMDSTQCYDFVAGAWNAEDADMGALMEPWWGMGYADKWHMGTDHQLWLVNGIYADVLYNGSWWFEVNVGGWGNGGTTPSGTTYRTSATTLDNEIYKIGGSIGGFTYSGLSDHHVQFLCDPNLCTEAWKEAPLVAEPGEVISYTITLAIPEPGPGILMIDPLPAGVEYADNLTYTMGYAWYSPTVNTVFWEYVEEPRAPAASRPAAPVPAVYDPDAVADVVGGPEPDAPAPAPEGPVTIWASPDAVLWDNGPLVTHPGGGSGGADASALQTAIGMNIYGYGNQFSVGNHMADDFEITDPAGWQIDAITFFAYQTNSPIDPSTISGLYLQIWDGPPNDGGSSVVWGDLTTNLLVNSTWTGIYRTLDTDLLNTQRPIMANTAAVGVMLPPGTYWLDWMTDGTLSSGPWAPPVTILGQTTTGNALQYTSTGWAPALDVGQQGMPFIIEGPGGVEPVEITFYVTVTAECNTTVFNEGWVSVPGKDIPFGAATEVTSDPEIGIEPPELLAEVCPDATQVLTLEICNLGCLPLEWELHEMTPTLRSAGAPVAPQVTLPDGVPPSLNEFVASGQPAFTVQPVAPTAPTAAPEALTYYATRAQFDTDYPGLPVEGYENGSMAPGTVDAIPHPLDEFSSNTYFDPGDILPGIQFWATVDQPTDDEIAVLGAGFAGNPDKTAVANYFVDGYRIVFDPPVQAAGMDLQDFMGTGSCQVDIYDTNGYLASVTSACDAVGVFWGVASDADPIAELVITDLGGGAEGVDNIAFGGEPFVYPDFPWISEDPLSGTLGAGMCQVVEVTFDATGLAPGDELFADLLILSNDPETPEVLVPTTMTVLEPVDLVSVTYTIDDLEVTFDATATGSEPITYDWDFDDGNTSTEEDPVHLYAAGGCYDVSLTVSNACDDDTWMEEICVCEPVYGLDFTWLPEFPIVGEEVAFTAMAEGTPPITFDWDFGDGAIGAGITATHVYTAAGDYLVTVVATNCEGATDVVSYTLTVESGKHYLYLPIVVKD